MSLFAPSGVFLPCGVHCPAVPPRPLTSGRGCVTEGSAAFCHFNLLLRWYFLLESRDDGAFCFPDLERLRQQFLFPFRNVSVSSERQES